MNFGKALSISFIVSSLFFLAVLFLLPNEYFPSSQTYSKKTTSPLQSLWVKDVAKMNKENLFPKEIQSISNVRVYMLDKNLHPYLKGLKSPFKTQKNSPYFLEVSFMSHYSEEDKADKIIVQYNILQNDTQEMLWELSRTLTVPPQKNKKPN